MKHLGGYIVSAFLSGLLIVVPIYLSVLLLLKAMQSVARLVKPIAGFLAKWFSRQEMLSLLLVMLVCFLIGIAARTPAGQGARERIEKSLFEKLPGYALFRSLTR